MRVQWGLVTSILVTVAIVNIYYTLHFSSDSDERYSHIAVIVLKLPRSGSSWFTELVNNDSHTFVSKEIIQSSDTHKFTAAQKEQQLAKALLAPTGKLARSNDYLPSGRFVEDYWLHSSLKFSTTRKVIGFTVNPEHINGISWKEIVDHMPNVKLVVYGRSNIVKSVISATRGRLLKEKCGLSNIKKGRADCTLPSNDTLVTKDLIDAAVTWQARYDAFYGYIRQDETLSKLPTMQVYYEELQADRPGTMQRLMQFLGHPQHAQGQSTKHTTERSAANDIVEKSSGWVKRSPDDLSQLYSNFDQVVRDLAIPECSALRNQLLDKTFRVFNRDALSKNDPNAMQDIIDCRSKLLPTP